MDKKRRSISKKHKNCSANTSISAIKSLMILSSRSIWMITILYSTLSYPRLRSKSFKPYKNQLSKANKPKKEVRLLTSLDLFIASLV